MRSILPKAVRELAQELSRLPGIGPKTAARLSIHLLRQQEVAVQRLADVLKTLHESVQTCTNCFSLSEETTCVICRDTTRNQNILCVVEDPLDIEAIEKTGTYKGLYHVLGGVLSPIEGITADQLTIHELIDRIDRAQITELIIALDHTMESDATTRYIIAGLKGKDISITRLARGLPTGGDIEFADATTLSAAFEGRKSISSNQ